MPRRAVTSVGLAGVVVALGWRVRALSPSGAVAALLVGTLIHLFGGIRGSSALIAFFLSGSVLSRRRRRRFEVVGRKGARRDAFQVLANGGVAALAVCVSGWMDAAAGAIAAACADTWATEIGAFSPSKPRSILGGRTVDPGTSGGVTVLGTLAGLLGAAMIGSIWASTERPGRRPRLASAITAAGLAGCLADSIVGATLQARYHCDVCDRAAEDPTDALGHSCRSTGGVAWVTNDVVNLVATATGAIVARVLVPR